MGNAERDAGERKSAKSSENRVVHDGPGSHETTENARGGEPLSEAVTAIELCGRDSVTAARSFTS
ncbi:hypothetical protein PTKU15_54220 [Paraburkholderia terrae]|nr:hypothetical protein PTKU15_54220 [Paraburkholderia terrae]